MGSRPWLTRLAKGDPQAVEHTTPLDATAEVADEDTCVLDPPLSLRLRLWQGIVAPRSPYRQAAAID